MKFRVNRNTKDSTCALVRAFGSPANGPAHSVLCLPEHKATLQILQILPQRMEQLIIELLGVTALERVCGWPVYYSQNVVGQFNLGLYSVLSSSMHRMTHEGLQRADIFHQAKYRTP